MKLNSHTKAQLRGAMANYKSWILSNLVKNYDYYSEASRQYVANASSKAAKKLSSHRMRGVRHQEVVSGTRESSPCEEATALIPEDAGVLSSPGIAEPASETDSSSSPGTDDPKGETSLSDIPCTLDPKDKDQVTSPPSTVDASDETQCLHLPGSSDWKDDADFMRSHDTVDSIEENQLLSSPGTSYLVEETDITSSPGVLDPNIEAQLTTSPGTSNLIVTADSSSFPGIVIPEDDADVSDEDEDHFSDCQESSDLANESHIGDLPAHNHSECDDRDDICQDPVDGSKENISPSEKKMGGRSQPSQPSITYTVSANDTLTSIAARFDTTPSELTKLNRLSTRFLFPGQILVVPDKSGTQDDKGGGDQLLQEDRNGQDLLTDARPITPTQRGEMKTPLSPHNYPRTPANSVEVEKSLDRECLEKFLKISVRHITDGQGVVAGVLLVTPNAIMFDPNVSDPLVIEHGPESYGVIAPMEYVVNGALFHDIAHMRVKDTNLPKPEIPKPEIYWGPGHGDQTGSQESPGKDASLSKDATFPELAASQDDNDSSCSCGGDTRESSAFPKAFEHELLTPIGSDVSPASGDGQSSPAQPSPSVHQQPTAPVAGDLTPIAEAGRSEDSQATTPNLAQTQCDSVAAQDLAQINLTSAALQTTEMAEESVCNDKKRTTSVTFDLTGEEEIIPDVAGEGIMQESRKQKVLKRLSYPLSWMESFSTDKENLPQHQNVTPSSAPAVSTSANAIPTDCPDATKAGMFSNVFSMSNVSNMLSRRPSLDFARRPGNQQPLSGMTQGMVHPTVPVVPVSTIQPEHQTVAPPANVMTSLQNQQAQKRAQYKEGPKFGLKSMVSMDDMPELFASFDKLIPKPATSCEDPPLYLCLRMGKPAVKSIPKSTPVMSYGKKRMRPEYWFSIPRNRVDELYNFFQLWAHDIYGELNEEEVVARGFVLVEEDTELWDDDGHEGGEGGDLIGGELTEMTKESWEVVSMSEELRRALYSSGSLTSLDLEVFLPDINGTTEIITDQVRKNLYKKLPARAQGYSWKLVFSTAQNGFSLNSLYRKMSDVDSPIMVFIQDTHQNVFGAVVSCSLHVSELFYGTGESFLFSFHPEFQVFPWTGENTFFVKGNNESLVIGGGDGNFGLWLDGDLYQGRTQPCKTFNNPQLTDTEDFIIKTIECWCFE